MLNRPNLISVLCLILGGCGYEMTGLNHNSSLYPKDVQTVAVPVFTNRSFRRDLEAELTKSIVQDIELHTPYKVVPPDRADTILEGEIVSAGINTVSPDNNTGLPQEQQYTVTVNFTWKNLRTGQILTKRTKFDQHESFFPTLGEDQSIGATAAVERLALGIVQEMQGEW